MTSTLQLFTAEEFYNYSRRVQEILEGWVLHHNGNVAQGLDAWVIVATELTNSETALTKHMDERTVNIFQWNSTGKFSDKLDKYRWNDVATAINYFIKEGGSKRNYFESVYADHYYEI